MHRLLPPVECILISRLQSIHVATTTTQGQLKVCQGTGEHAGGRSTQSHTILTRALLILPTSQYCAQKKKNSKDKRKTLLHWPLQPWINSILIYYSIFQGDKTAHYKNSLRPCETSIAPHGYSTYIRQIHLCFLPSTGTIVAVHINITIITALKKRAGKKVFDTSRTSAFSSWAPCEKLSRKTSTPARNSFSICSNVQDAGPSVAIWRDHRGGTGKKRGERAGRCNGGHTQSKQKQGVREVSQYLSLHKLHESIQFNNYSCSTIFNNNSCN